MTTETTQTSFAEALKKAITYAGTEVLRGEGVLYSLVTDYLGNRPENKQSLNLLHNAIECGIPAKLQSVLNQDAQTQAITVATCRMLLVSNYATDEKNAEEFMACFALALGWQAELKRPTPVIEQAPLSEQASPPKNPALEVAPIQQKQEPAPAQKTPEELCGLGTRYFNMKDYPLAVSLYEQAAARGHAMAQYNLGYCYHSGTGVKQDYAVSVTWLQKAAQQGIVQAQTLLGGCYCNGQGVEQNYRIAADWYQKAATQGSASGQFNLGFCYYYGEGVSKNLKEAKYWLEKAAAQGSESAQTLLMKIGGKKK